MTEKIEISAPRIAVRTPNGVSGARMPIPRSRNSGARMGMTIPNPRRSRKTVKMTGAMERFGPCSIGLPTLMVPRGSPPVNGLARAAGNGTVSPITLRTIAHYGYADPRAGRRTTRTLARIRLADDRPRTLVLRRRLPRRLGAQPPRLGPRDLLHALARRHVLRLR